MIVDVDSSTWISPQLFSIPSATTESPFLSPGLVQPEGASLIGSLLLTLVQVRSGPGASKIWPRSGLEAVASSPMWVLIQRNETCWIIVVVGSQERISLDRRKYVAPMDESCWTGMSVGMSLSLLPTHRSSMIHHHVNHTSTHQPLNHSFILPQALSNTRCQRKI